MGLLHRVSEGLARKTTRRGFLSRGSDVAFGALIGAAAGTVGAGRAIADHVPGHTACIFPGPPCPCDGCLESGVCGKPCIIMTVYYASGCWVSLNRQLETNVTCCDCDCNGFQGFQVCGCGSDHHNDPSHCP